MSLKVIPNVPVAINVKDRFYNIYNSNAVVMGSTDGYHDRENCNFMTNVTAHCLSVCQYASESSEAVPRLPAELTDVMLWLRLRRFLFSADSSALSASSLSVNFSR